MSTPTVLLRYRIQELIDELEGVQKPDSQRLRGDANRWISYIQGRLKEIIEDEPITVQSEAAGPEKTSPERPSPSVAGGSEREALG